MKTTPTQPLVSVRMVTYNHEPYIANAIESILSQKTNFDFELVIGEDCSTDRTRSIVLDYQKKYPEIIRLITTDQNVGMKKNGYRVEQACRGRYIAWCDGDDIWHREDKLQVQIDYIETHPQCGLVCSDYNLYNISTGKITTNVADGRGKNLQSPTIDDILLGRAKVLAVTVLARKELVLKVREADPFLFLDDHFLMGDTPLWAELSLISKIHYINESLATYNQIKESATQSKDELKRLRFWRSNAEMGLYLSDKHNLSSAIRKNKRAKFENYTLKLAFLQNRLDIANEVIKESRITSFRNLAFYLGTKYRLIRPFVFFLKWVDNSIHKSNSWQIYLHMVFLF